jgi:hypothetical protein
VKSSCRPSLLSGVLTNFRLDTLIVWTEPDGVDYALSFQDPEGCMELWNFILEVQSLRANSGGACVLDLGLYNVLKIPSTQRSSS